MGKIQKINIRNGFSDRNKIKPLKTIIQYDDFDEHTRRVLAVELSEYLHTLAYYNEHYCYGELGRLLSNTLFNKPYPVNYRVNFFDVSNDLLQICLNDDYDDVLTLIETFSSFYDLYELKFDDRRKHLEKYGTYYENGAARNDFLTIFDRFNILFESEFVGYKFINKKICKITSSIEIESINLTLNTPYNSVNEHFSKAIDFIKETGGKDYKNSIKESITALESLLNIVLGKTGLKLGKAMNEYFSQKNIHEALKDSIKSLYGFASDSEGVRHGNNKENYFEGFDEAKLVLVSTSAFINYIISTNQ